MNFPRIDYTPRTMPRAQAEEHNRQQCQRMARICKTLDDVIDLSIELAGHLSCDEHMKFRDMAVDAWFEYNVNLICDEVGERIRG